MSLHVLAPLLVALVACLSEKREMLCAPVARPDATRNVAILVYEGVELLDFAGPGEVFSAAHAGGAPAFRVYTVAKTKTALTSQGFVRVTPEFSIADCPAPDIVVIPGGNVPNEDEELRAWVRRSASSCELVMSVCNGALLLGGAGLLDGLEATTHHGSLEALAATVPTGRVYSNRRFVDNGRILTCAGVSAGIDGALHVVERLLGAESAHRTASYMEYDWRPEEIARQHAAPAAVVSSSAPRRLAPGEASARAFACPPCARACDEVRYAESGSCPSCGMTLAEKAARE